MKAFLQNTGWNIVPGSPSLIVKVVMARMSENTDQEMQMRRRNIRAAILRTAFRFAVVALIAVLVNLALSWVLHQLSAPDNRGAYRLVVILSLMVYALLMAIPFVPGIEIGLSLLMMQGAVVAPFVFLATFAGLTIAYLVGRFMPYKPLHDFFADLGLKSACRLLHRLQPLHHHERLDLIRKNLPGWLGAPLVRYRYLTIAVALNVPGNAFIGGGGGIALLAGLSRTFDNRIILICFALAVSPVPLVVYFLGFDAVGWIK